MTLGQKIKDMRKQMGISQEMLGEILNVSRQAITKWETDAGVPEVYNLQELAKVFGVPVDYFLSDKSINCNTKQLDIDITKYRNNGEDNVQIIRHFYSEEWTVKFLSFELYPKNPLVRYGAYILSWVSETIFNAVALTQVAHQVDNIKDTYYLISKDDMKFLAHITKEKIVIVNISDKKIKKGNIFYNLKHFDYDEKMFLIHNFDDTKNMTTPKYLLYTLKMICIVSLSILLFFVIYMIIMGLIN